MHSSARPSASLLRMLGFDTGFVIVSSAVQALCQFLKVSNIVIARVSKVA